MRGTVEYYFYQYFADFIYWTNDAFDGFIKELTNIFSASLFSQTNIYCKTIDKMIPCTMITHKLSPTEFALSHLQYIGCFEMKILYE
jgi:hypothetical protein